MTGHGRVAGLVAMLWMAGGCAGAQDPPRVVQPGIEVLLRDSVHLVRGRRVGLLTNQSGIDREGRRGVDRLREAGVNVTALFSPEHGFRGVAAPGEKVETTIDSLTGLTIYSLYGASRAPTPAMLAAVDVLLVDLQDVGARYYTYISSTIEVMRAAGRAGVPVIVLDRPNPIGGAVQGNMLQPGAQSFVGALEVPMRHGLTLGELARLARLDDSISVTLAVVPVSGWRRQEYFDQTGLPLVPPSVNLRTLEAMIHYPGLCLFEGTNLSVGRGSDHPFSQVGAPWLDPARVIAALGDQPGVRAEPVRFTPRAPGDGKYADTALAGIRLEVVDREQYDPAALAVHLLAAIRFVHPDRFGFLPASFDRLAGTTALRTALEGGATPGSIVAAWAADPARAGFLARRASVILYPD